MRRAGLVIASLLVAVGLAASAQAQLPPVDLEVIAVVLAVEPSPRCGDTHVAPLVRHRIERVASGTAPPGDLYAYYDCGQMALSGRGMWSVTPGMRVRIGLTRAAPWSAGPVGTPPAGAIAYYVVWGAPL